MAFNCHGVSQRLEQLSNQPFTCPARNEREFFCEGDRTICQLLPPFTSARHGSAEGAAHCDAKKRGQYVRPIVHILIKSPALVLSLSSAHQSDRIDVEQKCCRASRCGRLRV